MIAGIADAVVSDGAGGRVPDARAHLAAPAGRNGRRLRLGGALRLLFCSLLVLAASLLVRPAWADAPIEINSEADLVLRPYVRAVIEKDVPLTPEEAAKLGVDGIPHP